MRKKDEKLSLNMDKEYTLPNLEEGINIDEIPAIEDLIPLDKDEIEKIQETELSNKLNAYTEAPEMIDVSATLNVQEEDTTKNYELEDYSESTDAIDISSTINSMPQTLVENTEFDDIFNTFNNDTNIFDEDSCITLDMPVLGENKDDGEFDITFQNTTAESYEESEPLTKITHGSEEEILEESQESIDEPFIKEFPEEESTAIAEEAFGKSEQLSYNNNTDENDFSQTYEVVKEQYEEVLPDEQDFTNTLELSQENNEPEEMGLEIEEKIDNSIEALRNDEVFPEMPATQVVYKDIQSDIEQQHPETHMEMYDEKTYTSSTKHYSETDDVFAKIDSLLNDDSAFDGVSTTSAYSSELKADENFAKRISDNTNEYTKHKSTFNPAKYLNKSQSPTVESAEKLGVLYAAKKVINNPTNINAEINSPEKQPFSAVLMSENSKKILIAAAASAIVIGSVIILVSNFNNKSVKEIETLNKNEVTTPLEKPEEDFTQQITMQSDQKQSLIDENTEIASDTPDINLINKVKQSTNEVKKDVINEEITNQAQPVIPESYLSVKKIQWQLPEYLSASPNINSYLQAAGRSIKIRLSSDLLTANEYAYSNVVKVTLKLNNTGIVQSAAVTTSSGSKQIDNIVLQSVKDTLNAVKPPAGEIKTSDYNLIITIYL